VRLVTRRLYVVSAVLSTYPDPYFSTPEELIRLAYVENRRNELQSDRCFFEVKKRSSG
jgi:hypothetical protein